MAEFNIPALLYTILTSVIAWFLLWFVYDAMEIWQFLTPVAFTNLALAICLIVFVILGGIARARCVLKYLDAYWRGGNKRRTVQE